jgi:hypothetical protein
MGFDARDQKVGRCRACEARHIWGGAVAGLASSAPPYPITALVRQNPLGRRSRKLEIGPNDLLDSRMAAETLAP